MEYVRGMYGVPAKRGGRVRRLSVGKCAPRASYGTITKATHYVHVRLDDTKHSVPFHPTDLAYYDDDGIQVWPEEEAGDE